MNRVGAADLQESRLFTLNDERRNGNGEGAQDVVVLPSEVASSLMSRWAFQDKASRLNVTLSRIHLPQAVVLRTFKQGINKTEWVKREGS